MPRWPAESSLTVVSKAHSRRSTVGKSRNLITDKECMFFLWRSPEKKIFYAKKKLKEKKQKKIIAYRIWYVNILCFFFWKKAVLWGGQCTTWNFQAAPVNLFPKTAVFPELCLCGSFSVFSQIFRSVDLWLDVSIYGNT